MADFQKITTTTTTTKTQFMVDESESGSFTPKYDRVTQEVTVEVAIVSPSEWDEVAGTVTGNPTPPGRLVQLQQGRG